MRVFFKHGDGLASMDVENPTGKYLLWTAQLQEKFETYLKPSLNEDLTDIIETATPEEIAQLNTLIYEQINQMQFEELSKTDWYYVRKQELNIEVPIDVINERKEIREKYDNLKKNNKNIII